MRPNIERHVDELARKRPPVAASLPPSAEVPLRKPLSLLALPLAAGTAAADPWDDLVKPHLDCWYFGGGPGYEWFWSDVAPHPDRPAPTGSLPPCV